MSEMDTLIKISRRETVTCMNKNALTRPTKFRDFEQNINEDDLTHLPEILGKHELTMDFAAGSKRDFHRRSLETSLIDAYTIMFLMNKSRELLSRTGFRYCPWKP
jgi:hypothetical protein